MNLHEAFAASSLEDCSLRVHRLGRLTTAGKIVACDPLGGGPGRAFTPRFPSGTFDVELLLATREHDTRVALARVVFSRETPVRFALAVREGEDERALAPGQLFGFGVDAGVGAFIDARVDAALEEDILAELNAHAEPTWTWAARHPAGDGHRLWVFSSGYGDGIYGSYVGFGPGGEPVQLVIDFTCLELELPAITDDPSFRREKARAEWSRLRELVVRMRTDVEAFSEAHMLAHELTASAEDAAPLIEEMWSAYREAAATPHDRSAPRAVDVYEPVLRRTMQAPAAFIASLAHLDLADEESAEMFPSLRDTSPSLRDALFARYDEMHPALRAGVLQLTLAGEGRADPRLHDAVRRALVEPSMQGAALRTLDALLTMQVAEAKAIAEAHADRLAELGVHGADRKLRVDALRILAMLDRFPFDVLEQRDPRRRLEAASALSRWLRFSERTDPIFVELAADARLEPTERMDAASRIHDDAAKVDAYVALALLGEIGAPYQISYVRGPRAVAGLERVARESTDEKIAAHATQLLDRARR